MADAKLRPEEQAAAEAQAAADAAAREQAGAPPAKADARASAAPRVSKADAKAGSYDVLHGAVGEWPQGAVIAADDLAAAHVDEAGVRRLIALGAIAPHEDKPDAKE